MILSELEDRLAAVREWLKESPMSERVSTRRADELLRIVGRPDELGYLVYENIGYVRERWIEHASDCSVHNAPAYEPGPCDCGFAENTPDNRRSGGGDSERRVRCTARNPASGLRCMLFEGHDGMHASPDNCIWDHVSDRQKT